MSALFVFTADLHLQKNAWVNKTQLAGDAYSSLAVIVHHCVTNNLPLVLGGDIFDKLRPDPVSVSHFVFHMGVMQERGVPVYYVQGDHDKVEFPWPNAVSAWPRHLHHGTVDIGGYKLYGLDYQPQSQLHAQLKTVPDDTDFLITHQAWQEIQGIGHTEGSITQVPHAKFLLTGDYHVADQWVVGREAYDPITVYSAGSTCMQSLNESPDKSFIEVGVNESFGNLSFVRRPITTRPYFSYDIPSLEHLNSFCQQDFAAILSRTAELQLRATDIAKPIVRVRYKDDIADALSRITEALADNFHFFPVAEHVIEEVDVEFESAPEGAFDTLLAACQQLAPDEITYNDTRRVLLADDEEAELELMRQEFFNESDQANDDGVVSTPAP